jgi:hypothetical protein
MRKEIAGGQKHKRLQQAEALGTVKSNGICRTSFVMLPTLCCPFFGFQQQRIVVTAQQLSDAVAERA